MKDQPYSKTQWSIQPYCSPFGLSLIRKSKFNDSTIKLHHGFIDRYNYICDDFDNSTYHVTRSPPTDMRNDGQPVSIIIDLIKEW